MPQFPRAQPGQAIVLDGTVWNEAADILERFRNFRVTAPLEAAVVPGGITVSLRTLRWLVPLQVDSNLGPGKYLVKRGWWKQAITEGGNLDYEIALDWPDEPDAMLFNRPEQGRTTNRIAAGAIVFGFITDATSDTSKYPCYTLDYNEAVRRLRIKPDGTYLQVTTKDADILSLTDDDWRDEIPLTKCTATSTEALMAAMA